MDIKKLNWGVIITITWIVGIAYIWLFGKLNSPESLNELGDFLAGAFAPIAFLWLVLGYRQQGKQLEQNTKALEQQEKALQLQIDEMKENVQQQKIMVDLHKRQQDIYFKSVLPNFLGEFTFYEKLENGEDILYRFSMRWKNVGEEISDFLVLSHSTEETLFKDDILKRGNVTESIVFDTYEHVELEECEQFIGILFRVFYIDKLRNTHSELYMANILFDSIERREVHLLSIDLIDENYSCTNY